MLMLSLRPNGEAWEKQENKEPRTDVTRYLAVAETDCVKV